MKIFVVANFIKSYTVADPDLQIRDKGGGGGDRASRAPGAWSPKKFFSALRVSLWSKQKAGANPPPPHPRGYPLDPQLL